MVKVGSFGEGRTRMTGERKRPSANFKTNVAVEALRGGLTTVLVAAKHSTHRTMAGEWKKQPMAA